MDTSSMPLQPHNAISLIVAIFHCINSIQKPFHHFLQTLLCYFGMIFHILLNHEQVISLPLIIFAEYRDELSICL